MIYLITKLLSVATSQLRWPVRAFLFLIAIYSSQIIAHPQDEQIILDIEQGELSFDEKQLDREFQAALERKKQRQLNAMPWQQRVWLYFVAGVKHIIPLGADHILFVLGLFLCSLSLKHLAWQISAFTISHTTTLFLGVMGWVNISSALVEALIALSIVYIGIENIFVRGGLRYRLPIVFCFGLLHGLGFASMLEAMGIPRASIFSALISFNLGVELGQLLVVCIALALSYKWRNKPYFTHYVVVPLSALIALTGLIWFALRVVQFL